MSVPFKAYDAVPAEPLSGKVVIDTNNYYPQRDGTFAELDAAEVTSSELLQRHLAGASVVKAFNNIFFKHLQSLATPAGDPQRTALPIAGDDAAAKATVTQFLDAIGYDTVDVGTLADSWKFQPDTPAYGPPYGSFSDPIGTPADAETVRAAVDKAQR